MSDIVSFTLRLPVTVDTAITVAAGESGRSKNNEIVHRLQTYDGTPAMTTDDASKSAKSATLTVRLTDDMRAKLDTLAQRGPYKISITSIIERGIELAAQELEGLGAK